MRPVHHFHREPVWKPYRQLESAAIPGDVRYWLVEADSLTQCIIDLCDGPFVVEVLRQRWTRPMLNESLTLNIRPDAYALVREVRLLCNGAPWVYARTVIPAATLTGRQKRLAHLRNRSLGAMLFADPSMRRGELEIACLTESDKLFATATAGLEAKPAEIWGRRSVFTLGNKPLMVSEIFLPEIARP